VSRKITFCGASYYRPDVLPVTQPRRPGNEKNTSTHPNKAVVDRRLRPRWSYLKHTSYSRRYIRRDIMCHEYSTRPLRPSRPRPRRPKSRPVSVSPLARNGYSYAPFTAKSKAACGLCFHQLGGNLELPWLMRKHDVIHETGST